ncbi:MAG: nucleoside-diphosphate sugar epimerase, partial [Rhodoferax sp.]
MTNRIAIIAGATGLVGGGILAGLLADPDVAAVHSIGRKALPMQHPKLTAHVVDFAALPALPPADEVYLALGTTIKVAGSQEAFRGVDFDANLAVANAALAAGA